MARLGSELLEGSLAKYAGAGPAFGQATPRDWWLWWFMWTALLVIAYLTNPSAGTFRTHLTSLSFQTHLRRLSSNAPPAQPQPTARSSSPSLARSPLSGRGGQPSHVLSFSNRISLGVRTPAYTRKSYYFFSTVVMQPAPVSAGSQGRRGKDKTTVQPKEGEIWVGAFGRWYPWRWESEEAEEDERRGRLARGVLSLDLEDDSPKPDQPDQHQHQDIDSSELNAPATATGRHSSRPSRPSKRILQRGGRRASPTSLARLRSKAESSSNNTPSPASPTSPAANSNNSNHLPPTKQPPNGTDTGTGGTASKEEELGFAENDSSHPLVPGHFSLHSAQTAESVIESAEAVDTDPVLIELKMQLDELRATASETERRLQDDLEALRAKKRAEDTVRAELKAKTKQLEEAKRVAELARVEAERELNERKVRLREAKDRVENLRDEIALIDRREVEAEERREKKKRDRKEREKKLREDVIKKREQLKQAEDKVKQLRAKVSGVEKAVEIRRELLHARKSELSHRAAAFYPNQLYQPNGQPQPPSAGPFRRTPGQISAPFGGHPLPHHAHLHANMGLGMAPYNGPASRPSSIRSWDPQGPAAYPSQPPSPVIAQALLGQDDPSNYASGGAIVTGDGLYGGAFASDSFRTQPISHPGFLEHRIQHRQDHSLGGSSSNLHYGPEGLPYAPAQHPPGTLPSVDDIPPAFLPFDFESPEPNSASFNSSANTADDPHSLSRRPQLSLPLQYLDSGLLAGSMSPTSEGPLSPMTPHQTSLIPSQLFSMLDDDDDDEFVIPDSPTLTSHQRNEDWMGLGLDVTDLGAPASSANTSTSAAATASAAAAVSSGVPASSLLADLHENSQPAKLDTLRAGPLSPIEPRSPISPVSEKSEASSAFPSLLPSPPTTSASTPRLASSSQQNLANAFGFAPSPWAAAPAKDSLLSSKLSPTLESTQAQAQAASANDDLPRAGLSLNPDAKAFAFQPLQSVADASRAAFNRFPLSSFGSTSASAQPSAPGSSGGTRSGASSPTVSAFSSVIGPPTKSRMDFAQQQQPGSNAGSSNGHGSASGGSTSPIGTAAPGFAFDWHRPRKDTASPIGSDASSPRLASAQQQQQQQQQPAMKAFDPWGNE